MSELMLNSRASVTNMVTNVYPKWRQITPSHGIDFSLARLNPTKKPLFAVVASNDMTIGGGHQRALYQPLGSMPRFFNSSLANSLSQLARLTLSFNASLSNCSRNSGDKRKLNVGDLPTPLGLLSLFIIDMYTPITIVFKLIGIHTNTVKPIKAKPRSASNTNEASNQTAIRGNDYGYV